MQIDFTPAILTAVLGALVGFLAVIVPGFNTWWAAMSIDQQKAYSAIAGLVITAAIFGLSCAGVVIVSGVVCAMPGVMELLLVWISWIGGAALGFKVAPKSAKVRAAMK